MILNRLGSSKGYTLVGPNFFIEYLILGIFLVRIYEVP